jgi:hypothetical protein|nr:hypothetical protein [Bradyrhizobium sp. 1(2017)]
MMRQRFKQTKSLEERLTEKAISLHEQARMLPPGPLRDAVERKAQLTETASDINDWLRSPGLRAPTT